MDNNGKSLFTKTTCIAAHLYGSAELLSYNMPYIFLFITRKYIVIMFSHIHFSSSNTAVLMRYKYILMLITSHYNEKMY